MELTQQSRFWLVIRLIILVILQRKGAGKNEAKTWCSSFSWCGNRRSALEYFKKVSCLHKSRCKDLYIGRAKHFTFNKVTHLKNVVKIMCPYQFTNLRFRYLLISCTLLHLFNNWKAQLPLIIIIRLSYILYFRTSHHQFFVQREHGLMWCKVPKAASTSWLHAYLNLANIPEHEIPEVLRGLEMLKLCLNYDQDNGMGLHAFLRDKYPLLSKNLNKQFMPVSLKFLVVRHPFERVISAYMDKMEDYARDLKYRGGYYYAMYGADIVAKYRKKYQEKFPKNPLFMRKEPSFVEFVEFLIETPVSNYDEHWKPQFILCPPCHFKFDVVVKMETFDRCGYLNIWNFLLIKYLQGHRLHSQSKKSTGTSLTQ